jgi:glycosyltransferase involved in cell wall biosynthesis
MGHDVHVATASHPGAAHEETIEGVFVHRFRAYGNAVTGLGGDIAGYKQFVTSRPWDVVIMHCAQTWSTDALLASLGRLRCARIFVGHGFSALEDPAYQCYFGSLAQYLQQFQRVFTLSPLLEERDFCRSHGIPEPVIVPNGVDLEEWAQPPADIRVAWNIHSAPWILALSNHSTVKQHAVFFAVFNKIRKVLPTAKASIVGGHYPAARWNLGRLGVKGGCWYECSTRVLFEPAVSLRRNEHRRLVVSAVQQADVVLVTSSREASPLVVLECMAAGTPWVSLDVGCVRENRGGVIVKSSEEMASVALGLLTDPQRREQLGREGRKAAVEHHNWDRIAEIYENHSFLATQMLGHEQVCPDLS